MFSITLICMGKLKEKFYTEAAAEYAKRLKAYCAFQLIELPECRLPEDPSAAQIAQGLQKEAELIRAKLPKGCFFCVLTPEGRLLSSEQLADTLRQAKLGGRSGACFRHRAGDQGTCRPAAVYEQDDLSAPSRPRHGARAALPRRGHPGGQQIPQITGGFRNVSDERRNADRRQAQHPRR